MIAIVIPTYCRPDGKTYSYLDRALKSVYNQSYKDFSIFVIGDDYKKKNELFRLCYRYKAKVINLSESIERLKYPFGDYRLFCSGGITPYLKGIEFALKTGYKYICHLDHDDWWEKDHLWQIVNIIKQYNPLFICTLSTYYGTNLPYFDPDGKLFEYFPCAGGCVLSATCVKYSCTDLRFRDVFSETGTARPADADFWDRLGEEMKQSNKKGYLLSKITCHHDTEAYSINGKFNTDKNK